MNSKIVHTSLNTLIRLRDKWGFYGASVAEDQKTIHKHVKQKLDELVTFWLLDIYYTTHDSLKRNQITARLAQRKFPEKVNRVEIQDAVLSRLAAIKIYLKSSHGLLALNYEDFSRASEVVQDYFDSHAEFLESISLLGGEEYLAKLSAMIIEEEIA